MKSVTAWPKIGTISSFGTYTYTEVHLSAHCNEPRVMKYHSVR